MHQLKIKVACRQVCLIISATTIKQKAPTKGKHDRNILFGDQSSYLLTKKQRSLAIFLQSFALHWSCAIYFTKASHRWLLQNSVVKVIISVRIMIEDLKWKL